MSSSSYNSTPLSFFIRLARVTSFEAPSLAPTILYKSFSSSLFLNLNNPLSIASTFILAIAFVHCFFFFNSIDFISFSFFGTFFLFKFFCLPYDFGIQIRHPHISFLMFISLITLPLNAFF